MTPTAPSIDELRAAFEEVVDLTGVAFTPATRIGEDFAIDSSELRRVFARLAQTHGITVAIADLAAVETVGDLLAVLSRRAATP